MQTFLPYKNFQSSARVLDNKRLGKQRVETMQIMTAIVTIQRLDYSGTVTTVPWGNHPAVRMWLGHEFALMSYQQATCAEWTRRGFNDTCLEKTQAKFDRLGPELVLPSVPRWLGLKVFHSAHRANLLRKDPEYYAQWGWKEEPVEGYWWPTQERY